MTMKRYQVLSYEKFMNLLCSFFAWGSNITCLSIPIKRVALKPKKTSWFFLELLLETYEGAFHSVYLRSSETIDMNVLSSYYCSATEHEKMSLECVRRPTRNYAGIDVKRCILDFCPFMPP